MCARARRSNAAPGAWLRERLPAATFRLDCRPSRRSPSSGGHSNLTYWSGRRRRRLSSGGRRSVPCRRRRTTWRASSAGCRAARGFRARRVLSVRATCSVIGSVFYAMERRHGIIVAAQEPPPLADNPVRGARSAGLRRHAVDLHAIDVAGPRVRWGNRARIRERQVRGWSDRWVRSKDDGAARDGRAGRLAPRTPAPRSAGPSVVHATSSSTPDARPRHQPRRRRARLGNESRSAILWSTSGLCCLWNPPRRTVRVTHYTVTPGRDTSRADEVIERYSRGPPRSLDHSLLRDLCAVQIASSPADYYRYVTVQMPMCVSRVRCARRLPRAACRCTRQARLTFTEALRMQSRAAV